MIFLFLSLLANAEVKTCNGSSKNCDRPFNQVAYLTTHNAFNYEFRGKQKTGPAGFLYPNQERPVLLQLQEGVRGLMLDLHYRKNEIVLCHGGKACGLIGFQPLHEVFLDLKSFLENNPHEVVTLILESYVSVRDLSQQFKSANLNQYLHCQNLNQPWPTLGQMITATVRNNDSVLNSAECTQMGRLVVLNDSTDSDFKPLWNLPAYGTDGNQPAASFETHFSVRKPSQFKCDKNRGDANASLTILNHFLTGNAFRRLQAKKINSFDFLYQRASECSKIWNRIPNFITVDFYRKGNAMNVVRELNQ